ncbi:ABC transporter transmembrane domain-containing protein [Halomonas urumqiensis]|uniref:ABC transporter n=1 Tax=Halomonas urumqiensis TaxID=1684789 RepID=A0A2N7UQW4_9GAMM|nr:ABC transporter transmembrane domain-containing protein [Halomonas urumqiensis]PMR82828.1 ABC transporter [Halomonas urumqiensis]PTB01853.1 ABC transporter [Halomonas urumqiensis]GHE21956.1 ABC transporter ATP-binding protein/permease [Halomonas urumqiensis]
MRRHPDPLILLRLLDLLLPYRRRLLVAAIALLVAASSVLALGQGLRLMIDQGFLAADGESLARTLGLMLVVVTTLAGASALRYYLVTWIGERLAADLRRRVFDHLLTMEPAFFESSHKRHAQMRVGEGAGAGEIASRLTADTSVLQSLFGSSVSMAVRNLLMLIGAVGLMLITQPWLSVIVLLAIPATVLPILWFGRRVRRLSRTSQDRVAELGRYATETLTGMRTVQAFTHESSARKAYADRVEDAFAGAIDRTRQRAWLTGIAMLVVFSAVGIMLWQGGQAVLDGEMTPGELSAFLFYAVLAAGAVATLAEVAGDVQRAAGAAERLLELIDATPHIEAPASPTPLPSPLRGELRFEGVTFTYPGREHPALAGLDLTIGAGERLALVGPSGGGKSTLLALLLRFHDPDQGTIRLDGIDLRELAPTALRQCLGLVAQEPVLFDATVADNLRFGNPQATDEELHAAARDANALSFIASLPHGFDTSLGPSGVQLSGGQRQRLAIARALLKDPGILLLDEATSALDAESERLVQQALDRLMQDRTSVVIAHRLATVMAADRLLVINEGRIVAAGPHAELMASNTLYRHLAHLQFGETTPGDRDTNASAPGSERT